MTLSVDWSDLHPELIFTISQNLKIHKDYIRFRSVCSSWRKSTPKTPKHLPPQLPWLMFSKPSSNNLKKQHLKSFYDVSDVKNHYLPLPECSIFRRRCGSSHGYLVVLEETPEVFMINPLTRIKHSLPPLTSFPNVTKFDKYDIGREYTLRTLNGDVYSCSLKEMRDSFIKKVVFSSSPGDDSKSYVAVCILNQTGDLAYCKKDESVWRFIDSVQAYCEDVVYHKGWFYAVSKYGNIAVCDVSGDVANVSLVDTPFEAGGDMQYLVSLGDELLLVTRYLELGFDVDQNQNQLDVFYKTTEFRVFKLVVGGAMWESVGKLDEWALFLGENSSMAFRACDFEGCKGNSIYFTDDYSEWNYDCGNAEHDLGVYDLEDGSVVAFPCYSRRFYNGRRWPPPIWITPSLN